MVVFSTDHQAEEEPHDSRIGVLVQCSADKRCRQKDDHAGQDQNPDPFPGFQGFRHNTVKPECAAPHDKAEHSHEHLPGHGVGSRLPAQHEDGVGKDKHRKQEEENAVVALFDSVQQFTRQYP